MTSCTLQLAYIRVLSENNIIIKRNDIKIYYVKSKTSTQNEMKSATCDVTAPVRPLFPRRLQQWLRTKVSGSARLMGLTMLRARDV